ncbi:MAG: LysR family transcriptional regulator [Pseudomonas sp. PGPPP4]|uniref:LysR family transcriptional regulator n=1 Tax=Pseudomonas TaxID=286 RepID=UPI000BCBFC6A|nr:MULTISPECIES: LysR family transcriptional regulator [Pseudomonas]MCI1011194.1 LysR family transcriptional regulator [Pseudomonas oryzihabitans]OYT84140.1 MAG: LysR family transcriptional regulator [Pseudomonas sp. PGPPP4]
MPAPLDIDVLRTFHTIVRLGQFRAASLQLNRSPSAVSSQIRRLEEQTGGRLFERDNQAVTLTPLGRRVLLETADLLQTHDRILAGLTGQPVVGEVRLGVAEDYAARLLKAVLPRLQGEHPGIVLEVLTGNSSQLRRWLGQGLLDLALLVGPPRTDRADGERFGHTQPVWVAGPGLQLSADASVPLALHGEGCSYRELGIDLLIRQGRRWHAVVTSAASSALEAAVELGQAVAITDRARMTPPMRELTPEEGFPALPVHELRLASPPGERSPACASLAGLIAEDFRI